MNYTKKEIKKMTDLEINLAVAKKFFDSPYNQDIIITKGFLSGIMKMFKEVRPKVMVEYIGGGICTNYFNFDPCNSWKDIGMFIEESGVNINFDERLAYNGKIKSTNPNIKRAICEVYLLVE